MFLMGWSSFIKRVALSAPPVIICLLNRKTAVKLPTCLLKVGMPLLGFFLLRNGKRGQLYSALRTSIHECSTHAGNWGAYVCQWDSGDPHCATRMGFEHFFFVSGGKDDEMQADDDTCCWML